MNFAPFLICILLLVIIKMPAIVSFRMEHHPFDEGNISTSENKQQLFSDLKKKKYLKLSFEQSKNVSLEKE